VVKTVQMWEKRMDGGKHSTEKIKNGNEGGKHRTFHPPQEAKTAEILVLYL